MKRLIILSAVIGWLSCGVVAGGIMLAEFRGEYPENYRDPSWAAKNCKLYPIVGSLTGPVGMVMYFFLSGGAEHGITFTCEPVK